VSDQITELDQAEEELSSRIKGFDESIVFALRTVIAANYDATVSKQTSLDFDATRGALLVECPETQFVVWLSVATSKDLSKKGIDQWGGVEEGHDSAGS
jgi:hypothetical protein